MRTDPVADQPSLPPKQTPLRGVLQSRVEAPPIELSRFEPPEDLAPFVEHFWIVTWDMREIGPRTREVLPHPSLHWVTDNDTSEIQGIVRGRFSRALVGQGRVVSAKFMPGGLCGFVDESLHVFTGKRLPAANVLGPTMNDMPRVLRDLPNTDAVAHICGVLRGLNPKRDPEALRAGEIARAIESDRSIVKVAQVCAQFDISALMLQRLFRRKIGASPKWVIQRYRLHEAVERIHALPASAPPPWAALASELGFTDQAHFAHTFKAFVGATPGEYVRRLRLQDHR